MGQEFLLVPWSVFNKNKIRAKITSNERIKFDQTLKFRIMNPHQ